MKDSAELLNSTALSNLKNVRDKLLAHNELKFQNGNYQFIDIQSSGLKYGDERVLLEKASGVFADFFVLIKQTSVDWDDCKAIVERDAKEFWKED